MRGGVNIKIVGASYLMRPSYACIRDIEERTNATITELLELVLAQRVKIEEATVIVWYGCIAGGADWDSLEKLGDAVFAERLSSVPLRKALSEFLLNCLWAPDAAKKVYRRDSPDLRPERPRDWLSETFSFASVHLKWQPDAFWASTPFEFWAAQQTFEKKIEAINAASKNSD